MEKRKTIGVTRTVGNNEQQHTEAKTVTVRTKTESCEDTIYKLLFQKNEKES